MKSLSRVVCVGLALTAGCGAVAPEPGADAAVGDTVAPRVVGHTPADGAAEVAPDTTVSIAFDEPIASATLSAESFRLVDDAGVAVPGIVTAAADGGTFTPTQPLQVDRTYTATVTSAVTDAAGNALAADSVWSFAPHRRAWGMASLVETAGGPAGDPRMAVDGAGRAVAVWKQSDGVRHNIWAARYVGGAWQAPVLLETDDRGEAQSPQVAIDAAGNATVVWNQSDGVRFDIYATYLEAGLGWRSPRVISPQLEGNAYAPRLAVDAVGRGVAAWEQLDTNGRTNVWASRFTGPGNWTPPVILETSDVGDALEPTVAVDVDGDAVAVWVQSDGTQARLTSSHFTAAAGWTDATTIDTANPGNARGPAVVVANGVATVVWGHTDGARANLYTNRATGSAWGAATLLETDDAGDAYGARLAVDAAGHTIAVWYQSSGTRFDVWTTRHTGMGWAAPSRLETDDTSDAGSVSIACAASGDAVATWMQSDGTHFNVMARRYLAGAWQPVTLIETDDAGHAIAPEVVVDPTGNAIALWTQSDGTRTNIAANALR